ncbi:hypothetical protein [Pectinatus frisingensis]|uniref:hypothetical protein n=1 Tax=Pectinatus frisingensis TaxID=865 RepID=UPI0018C5E3E1|nr:hypothetical protein [Pectinatus frisingensis]
MKIYDCFTFYNEIELLELRLNLLAPYVDFFVLVEADVTHRGEIKQFYFDKNKKLFEKYAKQIIHIKMHGNKKVTVPNDWSLENLQRMYIKKGLNNCQPNDIVIISDADEIPNPEVIKAIKNNTLQIKGHIDKLHRIARKRKNKIGAYRNYIKLIYDYYKGNFICDILEKTPLVFSQEHYYYFMNYHHDDKWCGSVISLYKNMNTPQYLRDFRRKLPIISNGGWHFSYMGGIDRVLLKINSTVDENPTAANNKKYDIQYVQEHIQRGSLMYDYQDNELNVFKLVDIENIGIPNIEKFFTKYPYLYWHDIVSQ